MANYDFTTSLSPLDFELLTKDLLEAELGIRLENFSEGRDKGIDLRYAAAEEQTKPSTYGSTRLKQLLKSASKSPSETIVQCKRYASYSSLKSELKNKELAKITKLQPSRYILSTSVPLSPQQVDELKVTLSPYVLSTGDIFGRERLNSILNKHPEIERRHLKLWVNSSGVLDSILHAGTHVVSREEVERTIDAAKIYVRNASFDEALAILKEHHVCIISGLPGIGKTTLARMLLLYFYERKFDVIKIESDISEARNVGYHKNPRFYYYDDFLGQTAQADKLNKNEDQKLLDFMRSVKDSKDSLFVLTTREYILNQAKLYYEKMDRERFDHRTCVIDLSKYSRLIRAQILYNHLYFSDLPREHLKCLVAERGYVQIIDHPNYNPRLIEFLTSATWVGSTASNEYLRHFIVNLDNPVAIWDHAFRNQLSDAARNLLFVLTTLPTETILHQVETAFASFHNRQYLRTGIPHPPGSFTRTLKELDGTFVATRKLRDTILVSFQNPSIRDFMKNLLLGGESIREVIDSLVLFEQVQWFYESLTEEKPLVPVNVLVDHARLIADGMQKLFETESCTIWVEDNKYIQRVTIRKANAAARLALIASAASPTKTPRDIEFVTTQIARLAEQLDLGHLSASLCLAAVESLEKLGYLSTETGHRFVRALKASATNSPSDFDEFETLAGVVEALPESFSEGELEEIRVTYSSYAENFSIECAKGEFDITEPEAIREEASRVEYVGQLLGVDTEEAQKTICDYADKKERDAEENRNWDRDEDGHRGGGLTESCSDDDLDSMFGTLGA